MSDKFSEKHGELLRSLILECAASNAEIRQKLNQLSQLYGHLLMYPNAKTYAPLSSQALKLAGEIASACGLFEVVNWSNVSQNKVQQFSLWMLKYSPELSYYAEERARKQKHKAKSPFGRSVGYVFLSWSVSYPRERAAMLGVKDSLDYFGVKYYDFTEHRVDSSRDESDKIEVQICEAVNQSICSIELTSSEFQGRWIDFERRQLRNKENIARIILHLDKEIGVHSNDEFRILRLDFSDGRNRVHLTSDQAWQDRASDASYYQSQDYFSKCYALGHLIRKICNEKKPIKITNSLKPAQSVSPEKLSFPIKSVGSEETYRLLDRFGPARRYNRKIGHNLWFRWVIACTIGLSIGISTFELVGYWGIATFGVSVGIFQWLALRKYVSKVNSWVWWSTLGSAIGFMVVPGRIGALGVGAMVGGAIGLAQWNAIRWGVAEALIWLLASVFGFALGFAVANFVGLSITNNNDAGHILSGAVGGCVGGIMAGVLTGTALVWLLKRPASRI